MSQLAARLRAAREAAGLSLGTLAARTHDSKALLGHLETGRRTVKPEHVAAYARALGVGIESLYGAATDPVRVAHEWLVADTPVEIQTRAGRRVGASLATQLERRVVELRHLDDVINSADLYPVVSQELFTAEQVVNEASYSESVGRRLLMVVGELSQLAGWVAGDAGRYDQAQRHYLSGVSAARAAGNRTLAAQLLSTLSYQLANLGSFTDAVLLARTAVAGATDATPVARALLLERVAWACARAGQQDEARRALDAVDDAYEQRSPGTAEPEWVYWLNRDEIDIMAGRCLIELGDPDAAEPLLSAAIARYTPDHSREIALYQTWLAESYAKTGKLDAAQHLLTQARTTASRLTSTRLQHRIDELNNKLATLLPGSRTGRQIQNSSKSLKLSPKIDRPEK